jgi:hypothetical protein
MHVLIYVELQNTMDDNDWSSEEPSLSAAAAEWKPRTSTTTTVANHAPSSSTSSLDIDPSSSDLKATAIKEFIPGKGWVALTSTTWNTCEYIYKQCFWVCAAYQAKDRAPTGSLSHYVIPLL